MGVQWLDNVECSGTEDNIFDCPHGGLGQVDPSCSNALDVSVICQGPCMQYKTHIQLYTHTLYIHVHTCACIIETHEYYCW